jgi:hypothetical protein
MRSQHRPRIALAVTASLAIAASLATAAGHATPSGAPSWPRISGPTGAGPQLGLARTPDGTLHVIWNRGIGPTSIFDTRLSSSGTPIGTTTVASGWDGNGGLALLAMPDKTLRLFAAGGHTLGLGSSLVGVNTLTAPASGSAWTLQAGVVWGGAVANAASQIGAALTKDGQPVTAWAGTVHASLDPAAASVGFHADMGTSQLATDQTSGAVVLAGETIAGKGGTFVQQVLPSPGPSVLLPSALQERSSGLAARIGSSGVYVAYADAKSVRLFRYGGATKTIARGPYDATGVFAGPAGRLWITWGDASDGLFVTRSSRSVSAFEPVQKIALPAQTNALYHLQGEGSDGPLDLFADLLVGTKDRGFRHVHVLAEFSLHAHVTKTKTGAKVTLSARDAGDAIAGAAITVAGKHLRTNARGQATLALKPGTYSASATAAGYAARSARFSVR